MDITFGLIKQCEFSSDIGPGRPIETFTLNLQNCYFVEQLTGGDWRSYLHFFWLDSS